MRKLTMGEAQWLSGYALGVSHGVVGGMNLAACENCDWTAQAESLDFLMAEVTAHLEQSFTPPTDEQWEARREAFIQEFQWDPWEEGGVLHPDTEDGTPEHRYDTMSMVERSDDGEMISEEFFLKELEDGEPDE